MQLPLQVTFRHMDASDAMEANIRERVAELDKFFDQIMSCRVVVEASHKHHQQGNLYHVRIDLKVPGEELVVSRAPDEHHAHGDAYVAIRDAFDSVRRQLEDYARKRRGKVKQHEVSPHGRVSELYPINDYGRIVTSDGRDIYFHRNSVIKADLDEMEIGMEVRFTEASGEEGPQASAVRVVGKHSVVEP